MILNRCSGLRRRTRAGMSTDREMILGKTPWRNAWKRPNTPDVWSQNVSKVSPNRPFLALWPKPTRSNPKSQNGIFWTRTLQRSGFQGDQLETNLLVTMTFKHNGRFIPDRLISYPKSTFSHTVSLSQNEWCSNPKPQNYILGPKHYNVLGFEASSLR